MVKPIKTQSNFIEAIDVILSSGKILLESGSEIYRVEETMAHMASSLNLKDFEAYVVNRGIIASGYNQLGQKEAKVLNVGEPVFHLGKLEAVNQLSRQIVSEKITSIPLIKQKLDAINHMKDYSTFASLLSYFIGASSFSLALSSSFEDSLFAGLAGLLIGILFHYIRDKIHTEYLLTILGSSIATLIVNILYIFGIGEHRSLIILGALMVLIPGGLFVNAIREFSQNNFTTGISLIMSAILICISISVGVAVTIELIPSADQMTTTFTNHTNNFWTYLWRASMAGVGTIAFSLLYHVPKRYFIDLGMLGALSWLIYLFVSSNSKWNALAVFLSSLFVLLVSRSLSKKRQCPMTLFISTSMFPLIPGLSLYRAVYFIITGSEALAIDYFRACFVTAFTIAISISIVQQLPRKLFNVKRKKQKVT